MQHLLADWLEELDCDVDRWQIDLDEAAAAADAPGQEVARTEAWGVVGTVPGPRTASPRWCSPGTPTSSRPATAASGTAIPFVPWLADGAVHGRGACDMKAGVVASLGALAAVRTAGVRLVRPVALHGVVGEEDGGLGAWATLQRGHLGDVCVIPEPTAQAVVTANAGALTFRLEVAGRAAHAAMRDQGVSAVEVFADVHAELREFEAERQQDADPRFGDARYPYGLSIGRVRPATGPVLGARPAGRRGPLRRPAGRTGRDRPGGVRGAAGRDLRRAPVAGRAPGADHLDRRRLRQRRAADRATRCCRPCARRSPTPAAATLRSGRSPRAATCGSTPPPGCPTLHYGPGDLEPGPRPERSRCRSPRWSPRPAPSPC